VNVTNELDTRGLNCPIPILRTRKTIAGLSAGDVLRILSSDPGSVKDMQAFCRQTGNELIGSQQVDKSFVFLVRKA